MDIPSRFETQGYGATEEGALVIKRADEYYDPITGLDYPENIMADLADRVRSGELTDIDATNVALYLGIK